MVSERIELYQSYRSTREVIMKSSTGESEKDDPGSILEGHQSSKIMRFLPFLR